MEIFDHPGRVVYITTRLLISDLFTRLVAKRGLQYGLIFFVPWFGLDVRIKNGGGKEQVVLNSQGNVCHQHRKSKECLCAQLQRDRFLLKWLKI